MLLKTHLKKNKEIKKKKKQDLRKDCTSQNPLFLNHRELSPVTLGKAQDCAQPRFLSLQGSEDSTKCFHLDFFWAESDRKEQELSLFRIPAAQVALQPGTGTPTAVA